VVFTEALPSKWSYSITILLKSIVFWVVEPNIPEEHIASISRQCVPPKQLAVSELHCIMTQMTGLFIVAAGRTSNPVQYVII
jgi:hypothetical protein